MLVEQKKHDTLGGIGTGALRDEDEPFTLEQIIGPLWERGLIEDLTWTDLREGGKYFIRITPVGELCLGLGLMPRAPRKTSPQEIKKFTTADAEEQTKVADSLSLPRKGSNPHDPNEEKEAIA
jgi:hypothetical protein